MTHDFTRETEAEAAKREELAELLTIATDALRHLVHKFSIEAVPDGELRQHMSFMLSEYNYIIARAQKALKEID